MASADAVLTVASWDKVMPRDYRGNDLSAALRGYEGALKSAPAMPRLSADPSVAAIKAGMADLRKALADIKKLLQALAKVEAVAARTVGDLKNHAKLRNGTERKIYETAMKRASDIAAGARARMKALA